MFKFPWDSEKVTDHRFDVVSFGRNAGYFQTDTLTDAVECADRQLATGADEVRIYNGGGWWIDTFSRSV